MGCGLADGAPAAPAADRTLLHRPSVASRVVVTRALLAGGVSCYCERIGSDFLPAMDEGSHHPRLLDAAAGTSLTDTESDARPGREDRDRLAARTSRRIRAAPGTELGFFVTEPNRGDYVIRLKPREAAARRRGRSSTTCGRRSPPRSRRSARTSASSSRTRSATSRAASPSRSTSGSTARIRPSSSRRRAPRRRSSAASRRRGRLRRDHDRRTEPRRGGRGRTRSRASG